MADHFYGITIPGARQYVGGVSKATSTTSRNVELRVTDGVTGMSKEELLDAVEAIKAYITTDNAPA